MQIVIVGGGKIGITVTEDFVAEGFDVTVIDKDPAVISTITNTYDVIGVCGNGVDCELLAEAGIAKAELLVAVTGSDELNMLCCFLARKMGAKHTIARIRNPEYNDQSLSFMRHHLDLSMAINPELLAAQELFKILKMPSAITVETFSRRNYEMVEVLLRPESALSGHSLMELRKKYSAKFLVSVVQRGDKVYIPDGNFVLQEGDRIGISATPIEIHKLLRQIGLMQKSAKNVMILGASRTAYYLSKMLMDNGSAVKVVDKDFARCEEFSALLPGAVIIEGDGVQQELLLEESIDRMDAFLSLTGMDEGNILVSFFAAAQGVPKVIAKINSNELGSMAEKLGLECIISPKKVISDVLSRYARALKNSLGSSKVETLYKLMDGKAEALEFIVTPDFPGLDIPLQKLNLKKNILISGIVRGRKAIIPSGSDVILAGDRVIVLGAGTQLQDLSDILL